MNKYSLITIIYGIFIIYQITIFLNRILLQITPVRVKQIRYICPFVEKIPVWLEYDDY